MPAVAEELYEVRVLSAAWLLFAISGLATLWFRGETRRIRQNEPFCLMSRHHPQQRRGFAPRFFPEHWTKR